MKKLWLPCLVFLLCNTSSFAGSTDIEIDKGSVLVYSVKEGSKSFRYTVTIKEWDSPATIFAWQTNEKPKPRKGVCTFSKGYSSDIFVIGIGKSGDEKLGDAQTRIIVPAILNDDLYDEAEDATFTIDENGKRYAISTYEAEIKGYEEKPLTFNGNTITGNYTQITSPETKTQLGLLLDKNAYVYILSYYRSASLIIKIVSITSNKKPGAPLENSFSKLSAPKPIETKSVPAEMGAAKFVAVKKAYPLLATIENYDVTNGGKDPKPFSETYDYRQTTGATNPPSAIDCFMADLQIIYNQKKNFGLSDMTETVGKNNLPSTAAGKLLKVYLDKEASSIPGYKPWTHWKFVKSLSQPQLFQLAIELEGYIKQYGFTE